MRVNISKISSKLSGRSNLFLNPVERPLPEFDINSILKIERFTVSNSRPFPFENFEVDWLVTAAKNDINIADYQFRIKSHYDILADNIGNQGQISISIYNQTLLRVQASFIGSYKWYTLGNPITMPIDVSNCEEKDFPGVLLDDSLSDTTIAELENIPALRLRSGKEVEATWHNQYIEYKIPLEIVLNNFFNGDLDITWKVYFRIDYDSNSDCNLEVFISSNEDANFHWLEDLTTLGHTATIAATIERLMPTIMQPIISRAELAIANGLLTYLGLNNYFDTHKMMSVSIMPNLPFNHLKFMFCDKED